MQHLPICVFLSRAKSLFVPFEIYSFKGEFGLIDAAHVHRFYESLSERRIEKGPRRLHLHRKVSVDRNKKGAAHNIYPQP